MTLEHPDREIKETTPLSPTEILPQKFTLRRQLEKQNIRNHRNKQKESPKMERQRESPQSKGIEDSPLKELNKMAVTKLSDTVFKITAIKVLRELTDNYKELSENYISMKKEIEPINKNEEEMKNKTS